MSTTSDELGSPIVVLSAVPLVTLRVMLPPEVLSVAVSSVEHGYMKPHRSIFEAALRGAGVEASEAVMVGDSLTHDVDGARRLGMRGVLVSRSGPVVAPPDGPVIQSLRELPSLL